MFMLLGSAEKAGSGADKIMQGWKKANYRNPRIEEITHPDKVVLTLPLVSLLSDEIISYLKSLFGEDITSIKHNKLMTLATCCSEGEITNYRMQLVLDKHSADITKMFKKLCNDRYLIPEGIGRGTHYRINKKFREGGGSPLMLLVMLLVLQVKRGGEDYYPANCTQPFCSRVLILNRWKP